MIYIYIYIYRSRGLRGCPAAGRRRPDNTTANNTDNTHESYHHVY